MINVRFDLAQKNMFGRVDYAQEAVRNYPHFSKSERAIALASIEHTIAYNYGVDTFCNATTPASVAREIQRSCSSDSSLRPIVDEAAKLVKKAVKWRARKFYPMKLVEVRVDGSPELEFLIKKALLHMEYVQIERDEKADSTGIICATPYMRRVFVDGIKTIEYLDRIYGNGRVAYTCGYEGCNITLVFENGN